MTSSFAIIAGFLDRSESEVEGHALEAPSEAVLAKLRDFARGKLPDAERLEVICRLNQNPHWVQLLAEDLKSLRHQTTAANGQSAR